MSIKPLSDTKMNNRLDSWNEIVYLKGGNDMGNCPFCKQRVDIKEVKTEERGKGFIEKEKMYICPHCEAILGFAMKMR